MSLTPLVRLQSLLRQNNLINQLDTSRPAYMLVRGLVYYVGLDNDEALAHAAAFQRMRQLRALWPMAARCGRFFQYMLRHVCSPEMVGWHLFKQTHVRMILKQLMETIGY